jgi:hypothetical protein
MHALALQRGGAALPPFTTAQHDAAILLALLGAALAAVTVALSRRDERRQEAIR